MVLQQQVRSSVKGEGIDTEITHLKLTVGEGQIKELLKLASNIKLINWGLGVEPAVRIELTTDGLQNRCSTAELSWRPRK